MKRSYKENNIQMESIQNKKIKLDNLDNSLLSPSNYSQQESTVEDKDSDSDTLSEKVSFNNHEGLSDFSPINSSEQDLGDSEADASVDNKGIDIFEAARNGDIELVRKLLPEVTNINALDDFGETILCNAVYSKNLELVELILTHPNINIEMGEASDNKSPLYWAACISEPSIEIVKALLNAGANPLTMTKYQGTIFHSCGDVEIFELILNTCIEKEEDLLNMKDSMNYTPLKSAVVGNNPNIVKFLIEKGVKVDEFYLDLAIYQANIPVIEVLKQHINLKTIKLQDVITTLEQGLENRGYDSYDISDYLSGMASEFDNDDNI